MFIYIGVLLMRAIADSKILENRFIWVWPACTAKIFYYTNRGLSGGICRPVFAYVKYL